MPQPKVDSLVAGLSIDDSDVRAAALDGPGGRDQVAELCDPADLDPADQAALRR